MNKFHSKLKENKNIEIFGNVSEVLYVNDLVGAMLSSLKVEKAINEIFHLASGNEVKISHLAQILIVLCVKMFINHNTEQTDW